MVRISNTEVIIALVIAGMVNMAMVMMASSAFHAGHSDVAEIETAYHTLTPLLGIAAAGVFLLSLLASGVSSSTVGTLAGQMIMQGFVGFRIPIWVRRLVTMAPAFVVVGLGANATNALVISQVVLSIALPLPMIALLIFTRSPDIMGRFANGRLTNTAAIVGNFVVLLLNVFLILQTFGVTIPGIACVMTRSSKVTMRMPTLRPIGDGCMSGEAIRRKGGSGNRRGFMLLALPWLSSSNPLRPRA